MEEVSYPGNLEDGHQVVINIGELFVDLLPKKNESLKSNATIQDQVRQNFAKITGFDVPHRKFKEIVSRFVRMFKANRGRKELGVLFSSWFSESVNIDVDKETVNNATLFKKPEPTVSVTTTPCSTTPAAPLLATPSFSSSSRQSSTVPSTPLSISLTSRGGNATPSSTPLTSRKVNVLRKLRQTSFPSTPSRNVAGLTTASTPNSIKLKPVI